jgi:hypothetical protein
MRRARLLHLAFLAAALPASASAAPPSPLHKVRLSYRAPPGCMDEKLLGYVLRSKLTFDPFDPGATSRLSITVKREGGRYVGVAELREPGEAKPWVRSFPPMSSCDDAVDALVFAVAVHLGPSSPPSPSPSPSSSSLPLPSPLSSPPVETPAQVLRLGAGAALGLGVSPASAAPGVAVEVGIRWFRWAPLSLSLEGRAYPSTNRTEESTGTRMTTGLYTGALLPCAHIHLAAALELAGCTLVELGALHVTSDAPSPTPAMLLHAAVGLRGGVEVPLMDHLALRATGDATLSLRRYGVVTYGSTVWETPLVSAGLSVGAVASFW